MEKISSEEHQIDLVQILTSLLSTYMILNTLLDLYEPQVPNL